MHTKLFAAVILLQILAIAVTSASFPYYHPFLPTIGSASFLPPAFGQPLLPPTPPAVLPVVPKFVKIVPPSVPPHAYSVNIVTRALTPPAPVLLPPYAAALPPPLPAPVAPAPPLPQPFFPPYATVAPAPQPFFPPYTTVPSTQPFLPSSPFPFWRR